jgi:hypothetical protein
MDSSIGKGFEIVTKPMPYEEQLKLFSSLLEDIKKEGGSTDSMCGMHIHYNRAALSYDKVCEIEDFLLDGNHRQYMIDLSRRGKESKYAKFSPCFKKPFRSLPEVCVCWLLCHFILLLTR